MRAAQESVSFLVERTINFMHNANEIRVANALLVCSQPASYFLHHPPSVSLTCLARHLGITTHIRYCGHQSARCPNDGKRPAACSSSRCIRGEKYPKSFTCTHVIRRRWAWY